MRIKLLAILALAALTVLALACGDDDDDSGDDANGDGAATTAPAGNAPTDAATDASTEAADATEDGDGDGGSAETVAIEIANFTFEPSEFSVPAGTVAFDVSNEDSAAHTFTVYADEAYTEPTAVNVSVGGGSSGSGDGSFEAGPYFFRCEFHPDMQGTFTAE